MNIKVTTRIILYALIAALTVGYDNIKEGMTQIEIIKTAVACLLSSFIAIRAFLDQTPSQENVRL